MYNKSAAALRAQTLILYFCSKQTIGASADRALQRWQTLLRYVFAPRRAPQITVLCACFSTMAQYTDLANKSAQSALKAAKNAVSYYCARIIGKKPRNINAIRPYRACIVPPYALKVRHPYLAASDYAVFSKKFF